MVKAGKELHPQPADELHRAHSEPLKDPHEQRQLHVVFGNALVLLLQPLRAPCKFRLVAHCVDAFEVRLASDHQVMRHAEEMGLDGLGIGRTGPCLRLAQFAL